MSHAMNVYFGTDGRMAPGRFRSWYALAARFRAASLDRELARGDAPASCAYLAARARRLTSARYRRELAAALGRLLAQADGRPSGHDIVSRKQIAAAAEELAELADRLRAPVPLPPRGVAMVCDLLRDGGGPVDRDRGPGALRHAAARALRALAEPAAI